MNANEEERLRHTIAVLSVEVRHAFTEGFFCGLRAASDGLGEESLGHPVLNAERQWEGSQAHQSLDATMSVASK